MTETDWEKHATELERISQLKFNFDLKAEGKLTAELGWHADHYQIELPSELAGPPVESGSFMEAKKVIHDYKFPDPSLISGIFIPTGLLVGRNMLLQAHFLGFTFYFGVRITEETNETRKTPLGDIQVWGYSYATLQGHFEMGRISFEVWKFEKDGKVEFHIDSFSKAEHITNIFYRLGFRIFGRSLQKRFAQTALERTYSIVVASPRRAGIEAQTKSESFSAQKNQMPISSSSKR